MHGSFEARGTQKRQARLKAQSFPHRCTHNKTLAPPSSTPQAFNHLLSHPHIATSIHPFKSTPTTFNMREIVSYIASSTDEAELFRRVCLDPLNCYPTTLKLQDIYLLTESFYRSISKLANVYVLYLSAPLPKLTSIQGNQIGAAFWCVQFFLADLSRRIRDGTFYNTNYSVGKLSQASTVSMDPECKFPVLWKPLNMGLNSSLVTMVLPTSNSSA